MRKRLRDAYPPEILAGMYAAPHDHTRYQDHAPRVECTISMARALCREAGVTPGTIADLSCGDAAIARAIGAPVLILGDLAPGYPVTGPIEQTITRVPHADLFIFSETAEHLDDPDKVLRQIREKARLLIMSTPIAEWADDNPEHYWGWDEHEVEEMLRRAGWHPAVRGTVITPGAAFQIWGCT